MPTENKPAEPSFDLNMPDGGRDYIANLFKTVLKRHDYRQYINERLAGDFACTLAQHFEDIKTREQALQLRLNAADEALDKAGDDFSLLSLEAGQRMDLLVGLLRECLDCVRNGEDFDLPVTTMARIDAALKPAVGERDHQIPGTSGMRLNMLANQGE
jgi:hypothetical protein